VLSSAQAQEQEPTLYLYNPFLISLHGTKGGVQEAGTYRVDSFQAR